jgi:hypothetical protein
VVPNKYVACSSFWMGQHPTLIQNNRQISSFEYFNRKTTAWQIILNWMVVRIPRIWFTVVFSSVSIVTDYGLDDRGSISWRATNFPHLLKVQTASGAHPVSDPVGTGGSSRGGQAARGLTTRLYPAPSSTMMELYLHSPYVLWCGS